MTVYNFNEDPKAMLETLVVAKESIAMSAMNQPNWQFHIRRLQRLILECERMIEKSKVD